MAECEPIVLDLRGLKCPLPVIRTRKRLMTEPQGARLEVLTTDPLAMIDIPHFCAEYGHVLESSQSLEKGHRFVIRKVSADHEQP